MENKKLLFSVTKKDLEISFFSGKGPGGQNRNKHQNCVRIRHKESGASSTGQNHKERQRNIKDALYSLSEHPKFKLWVNRRIWEIDNGKTVEEEVEEMMNPKNIITEILSEQQWIKVNEEYWKTEEDKK